MSKKRIRDYIVDGLIGRGGMGSVYLATHVHLKRKAALKVLLEQFSENESIKERFVNEASLLHDLQHKNIVQQREFFEENGRLILVMEYVDGLALDKMISDMGPIPWERALPLFIQMLNGISYAHSKNIIHRDIKPANILISKDGLVKVTDLGIAKFAGKQGLTRTGAQLGTLYYESPEQIQGAKGVSYLSDIYSLGMTLYQMIAGRLPFDTDNDVSEFTVMNAIVHRKDNLDPREYYPHIPEWLVKIVQKSTHLDPAKRFQSCDEFRDSLVKFANLTETQTKFWAVRVASSIATSTKIGSSENPDRLPTSASIIRCPECDSKINDGMILCSACGADLQKDCPSCRNKIKWYQMFCPSCGYDFSDKPHSQGVGNAILQNNPKEYDRVQTRNLNNRNQHNQSSINKEKITPPIQTFGRTTGVSFKIKLVIATAVIVALVWIISSLSGNAASDSPESVADAVVLNTVADDTTAGSIEESFSVGMEFITVPSGNFLMGSPSSETERDSDESQHRVYVESFELMTTEVTQSMWESVMGLDIGEQRQYADPSWSLAGEGSNYPVYYVSWYECQEFINRLNDLDSEHDYRLPSEAEWEYAYRAGTTSRFFWGHSDSESVMKEYCWYESNADQEKWTSPHAYSSGTQPVATKSPNSWGFFDMSGNVYEWCEDVYVSDYFQCPTDGTAYIGSGTQRINRGGGWVSRTKFCRSSFRNNDTPDYRSNCIGFRVVRI